MEDYYNMKNTLKKESVKTEEEEMKSWEKYILEHEADLEKVKDFIEAEWMKYITPGDDIDE